MYIYIGLHVSIVCMLNINVQMNRSLCQYLAMWAGVLYGLCEAPGAGDR